ncbi:MAG TPA: cytochrome c, partial [Denitromonas sp.]|nr:cytochrome c [Denitromonas sp.]
MHTLIHVIILLGVSLFVSHVSAAPADAMLLFVQHCASCHGMDRLGAMGPALLPDNLSRLRKKVAREVVVNGRPATQMPAFGETLDDAQIDALV